jgi:hypothetical protein
MHPRVHKLTAAALAGAVFVACAPEAAPPPTLARLDFDGCVPWIGQPIDRVCAPRSVREGAKLELEVSGEASCGSTVEKCSVRVDGRDVYLSIDGRTCSQGPTEDCSKGRRTVCSIPPLDIGRHRILYEDNTGRSFVLDAVADPLAATTCSL